MSPYIRTTDAVTSSSNNDSTNATTPAPANPNGNSVQDNEVSTSIRNLSATHIANYDRRRLMMDPSPAFASGSSSASTSSASNTSSSASRTSSSSAFAVVNSSSFANTSSAASHSSFASIASSPSAFAVVNSSSSASTSSATRDQQREERSNLLEIINKNHPGIYGLITENRPGTTEQFLNKYVPGPSSLLLGSRLLKRKKLDHTVDRLLHLPFPVHSSVSANIPLPPNWNEHMNDVSQSLAAYKLFPIHPTACEYRKLALLLHPVIVNEVDQIVNPTVWNRFVNARNEMLKAKCDNRRVLQELGLSDTEITKRQQSLNFMRHNAIDEAPYNENFVLLFHCTQNVENIEQILRDGFDDRLARGGFLGKGIYFSDNTQKSIKYDGCGGVLFVCAVLLGDCFMNYQRTLTSSTKEYLQTLVREPEKLPSERRNINDNFFDSAHGANTSNQYAVYDRYQCCPLYKVRYSPGSTVMINNALNIDKIPFGWLPSNNSFRSYNIHSAWILSARAVFDEIDEMESNEPAGPSNGNRSIRTSTDEKLSILLSLGYTDTELNLKTLEESDFSIARTVYLLSKRETENKSESESELSSYHSSTDEDEAPRERRRRLKTKTPKKAPETECSICCQTYASASENWRALPRCQHKLCVNCYQNIEVCRSTMTGESHTFMKCPFCLTANGIEIGLCPDGEMHVATTPSHCLGYDEYGAIVITYKVNTPMFRLKRVAFLPDNEEGQNVLQFLRIAWNRRLTFTIGTSHTTGYDNSLVWNIHHKTSLTGGVACHGYPDDSYLTRVTQELKSYGIE